MFCPKCGQSQKDDLNYCKSCGANLNVVRTAMVKPEKSGETDDFDWTRTWLAESLMTGDEKDRKRGYTPEMKRRREIKAGVITASSGLGLTIALASIMAGIIAAGVSDKATAILSSLWVVGLIPILIGAALIFNGVFISPKGKITESEFEESNADTPKELEMPAETNQLSAQQPFSVTDDTTRHLDEPVYVEKIKTK